MSTSSICVRAFSPSYSFIDRPMPGDINVRNPFANHIASKYGLKANPFESAEMIRL